jgi:hypothetical protein
LSWRGSNLFHTIQQGLQTAPFFLYFLYFPPIILQV